MIDATALIGILESEKESYKSLLDLSKKKQDFIVKGDVEGLTGAVKAAERMMISACNLEKERLALFGVDVKKGLPQETPNLSSLIKGFDTVSAAKAARLKDELIALVAELDEANKTNAELLQKHLSYIGFMLNVITQEDNPTYSNKSNPKGSSLRLIDGKA